MTATVLATLLLSSGVGVLGTVLSVRRFGFASFTVLMHILYLMVFSLSSYFHLNPSSPTSGGYYEVTSTITAQSPYRAALMTLLGQSLLTAVTISRARPVTLQEWARRSDERLPKLLLPGVALVAISLPAAMKMFSFASQSANSRIISLDGGLARYAYLAQWSAWGIIFIALAMVWRLGERQSVTRITIILSAAVAIAASLSWTGGRAIALVFILPLLIAVWPTMSKVERTTTAVTIGVGTTLVAAWLTRERDIVDGTIADIMDWQLGRYSMNAFASDYVTQHGHTFGETYLAALLVIPIAAASFLGDSLGFGGSVWGITNISGWGILGNPDETYVVPGAIAEAYINFGFLGVAALVSGIGLAVTWIDRRLQNEGNPAVRLALSYLGAVTIFCTLTSSSSALISYLTFIGAPCLWIGLDSVRKRASVSESGRHRRPSGSERRLE
jgi:hypothetical protein